MGVRSYLEHPDDIAELRETTASLTKAPSAFRPRPSANLPVLPVALLLEPEVFSSREYVQRNVEDMRPDYIHAVETSDPLPSSIFEAAQAQPEYMTPSANPTANRPLTAHENDDTSISISRLPSAPSARDHLHPTTQVSRNRTSLYPAGDFRNSSMPDIIDMKTEIMCNYLHQQQLKRMWSNGGCEEGVLLKKSREEYTCCPPDLQLQANGLFDAVKGLNVRVCRLTRPCGNNADSPVCNDR